MYEYPKQKRVERPTPEPLPRPTLDAKPATPSGPIITPGNIFLWLRRGLFVILLFAIVGAAAGVAFGVLVKPRYTASMDILLPPPSGQVLPNELTVPALQSEAQILDMSSKILLLNSGNVLRRTVEREQLQQLPEFNPSLEPGFNLMEALGLSSPKPPGDQTLTAMRILDKRIKVSRQGGTYLVNITLWTRDPERSVKILATLAESFRQELEAGRSDLAKSASTALATRLEELRGAATEAANAVVEFRQKNNLQDLGSVGSVNVQSLSQLNTRLNDANSRLQDVRERYKKLSQTSANGVAGTSSLSSPLLDTLRSQYSVLKQQYDELALTYGERYPKLAASRAQLATLRSEIARETDRVLQSVKIEMDQAQSAVDSLRSQINTAQGRVSNDDAAQVELQDLQRNAEAKAALYDTFLKRAGETGEQEQLNVSNLRIVTEPVPPERRNFPPPTSLLAIGGLIAGLLLGVFFVIAGRTLIELRRNDWRFERIV